MKKTAGALDQLSAVEEYLSAALEDAEEQKSKKIRSITKKTRSKAKEVLEEPENLNGVAERVDRLRLFLKLIRNMQMNNGMFEKKGGVKLRINQLRGIQKLIEFLQKEGHGGTLGYFKQPTGAGKTVLFSVMARLLDVKTLILVPRTNLLNQTKNEMVKIVGIPEEQIGIVGNGKIQLGNKFTIANYQSHVQRMKKDEKYSEEMKDCELIICDEAHRSLGNATQESLQALDGEYDDLLTEQEAESEEEVLSSLEKYTSKKALRLGFTATPALASKHLDDTFHHLIGEEKQSELVRAGILVPYRIIRVDGSVQEGEIEDYLSEKKETEILIREGIYEKLLGEYSATLEEYKERKKGEEYPLKGVAFCVNIEECDNFKKEAEDHGLKCEIVTSREARGKHGLEVLEKAEQRLVDGEIDLIITVNKLGEGWNFPPANAAIWARATTSPMIVVQGVGRVSRSHIDKDNIQKEYAYVFETDWSMKGNEKSKRCKRPLRVADALAINGENPNEFCSMEDGSKLEYNMANKVESDGTVLLPDGTIGATDSMYAKALGMRPERLKRKIIEAGLKIIAKARSGNLAVDVYRKDEIDALPYVLEFHEAGDNLVKDDGSVDMPDGKQGIADWFYANVNNMEGTKLRAEITKAGLKPIGKAWSGTLIADVYLKSEIESLQYVKETLVSKDRKVLKDGTVIMDGDIVGVAPVAHGKFIGMKSDRLKECIVEAKLKSIGKARNGTMTVDIYRKDEVDALPYVIKFKSAGDKEVLIDGTVKMPGKIIGVGEQAYATANGVNPNTIRRQVAAAGLEPIGYAWSGKMIVDIYKKSEIDKLECIKGAE